MKCRLAGKVIPNYRSTSASDQTSADSAVRALSLSRFTGCSVKSCPVSVCCPNFLSGVYLSGFCMSPFCPLSGFCPNLEKKLFVVCLSVRRQSRPDFHFRRWSFLRHQKQKNVTKIEILSPTSKVCHKFRVTFCHFFTLECL